MENSASSFDYRTYLRQVEEIIKEVFIYNGFAPDGQAVECLRQSQIEEYQPDLSFEKNGKIVMVEILVSNSIYAPVDHVYGTYNTILDCVLGCSKEVIPIIVSTGIISEQLRNSLMNGAGISNLCIIDIQNLLFMVQSNELLRNKLVTILPFSIDEIIPEKVDWEWSSRADGEVCLDYEELINRIKNWNPAEQSSQEYERLCVEVLQVLFADDLALWFTQQQSDEGLFRFDLICKITNGNSQEFWHMMEHYFRSKYIVFEFKNYSDKITQKEVFTTVKYLYVKALRRVALLISTNGSDDHAEKAIRGILRDEGKLIISLGNQDLIEMLQMKRENYNPSDYLSNKLDLLLIDLEK